ncbi:Oleandomycin glycosyltransferase [Bhargavaea cecembensis DSE10]|uniref:Oleandomycin glycosyltransferase n=1 Tax=Bhargavaea cecembensis DSE10 TaxID=1235279 RepID=M7P637_9BACL|nr:macrolide family glycosyltransferase [Bhargavaea cecembensis]EMR06004.1 Oleandomycin glycosyltransferase [Bhargavaea cecembensis DSE10]
MSRIVFFSLPAHGHTNPTLPVVRELTERGHEVWYYSFREFREKIIAAGARYIECDQYLPQATNEEISKKAGKDFSALIEMTMETTLAMQEKVLKELSTIRPDCIVSDSMSVWGKLYAQKLDIPFISSTTTFAFNQHTAKLMKPGFKEALKMITGMGRIRRKINELQQAGYEVDSFTSLIGNDNETETIVFTTREFQPLAETFSGRFAFVGPSMPSIGPKTAKKDKTGILVYVSLGTVLNNAHFHKNCISALAGSGFEVVMSVGEKTDIGQFGKLPDNFTIKKTVDQIAVLGQADLFITHSGMNSVSESLYQGVPMVLYPMHSEQKLAAQRVADLGAGIILKNDRPQTIREAVRQVLEEPQYRRNTATLSGQFRNAGGAAAAADAILSRIKREEP